MEQTLKIRERAADETRNGALVREWQKSQLRRLGLSGPLAELFCGHVDWHEIAALVERGCPAELALEIVR